MTLMGRRLAWAILVVTLATTGACSGDDDDPSPTTSTPATTATTVGGISEAEAIEIAREQVVADDPEFDVESTRPVVVASDDTYDVSFPEKDPAGPGGEPHVVVDRETGEIVETYLTR